MRRRTWTGLVHLEAKIQHSGSWWFFSIGNILRKKQNFKHQKTTLHEQEGLNQIRNRQTEDPSNPIKRYWHTSGSGDIRMFRIFWSFFILNIQNISRIHTPCKCKNIYNAKHIANDQSNPIKCFRHTYTPSGNVISFF